MTAAKYATGTAISTITVSGLIVGHEYRLQLISNKPRQGVVDVEGTTGAFTVGDTDAATMLTATWVAADVTLNAGFVNQTHSDGPHFCGYALHDITPVTADAGTSTVTASPTTVASDGVTTSTITVTLKDASSAPVSGKTVTLASDRGTADTISAASGSSNGSGVVTFSVTSTTTGSPVFTATDTSDSPQRGGHANRHCELRCGCGESVLNSTVVASPTRRGGRNHHFHDHRHLERCH